MKISPDVLGYKLEDALDLLKKDSLKWLITESTGKYNNKQGDSRIIKIKNLSHGTIELIISYF